MKINLNLIKQKRLQLGLNIDQMAEALNLTNGSMYWKRENGDYKFKAEEIMKLSNVLGIPMNDLFLYFENSKTEIRENKQAI